MHRLRFLRPTHRFSNRDLTAPTVTAPPLQIWLRSHSYDCLYPLCAPCLRLWSHRSSSSSSDLSRRPPSFFSDRDSPTPVTTTRSHRRFVAPHLPAVPRASLASSGEYRPSSPSSSSSFSSSSSLLLFSWTVATFSTAARAN
ncbi:formin-like protein 3 isoform X2 [Iris pallida]|uniref:Formin-like protein 3 isoform X2 n=1 Tax=Iris pallida TaxID=29817 RepID=A0AAX6I155_IRIPA|nr:formin-like protein 3 isoform X2 [Iris pallida]